MRSCCTTARWPDLSRRQAMMGALALGGGVSLLRPTIAKAAGGTEMLLLSCMDYRLTNEIAAYMEARGLQHRYDHVVLAGASLGALNGKYPMWADTFWAHLDIALELHHVHRVMILDHRDCGAYKVFLGEEAVKDEGAELKTHVEQLYALRSRIVQRHHGMEVELGLMGLDGKVLQIV